MKKIFKNPLLSALLISILAAALWEKFISPFCTFIFIHISSLIEVFISTFLDRTYKEISNGFDDSYTIYVLMFILCGYLMIVLVPFIYPIAQKFHINSIKRIIDKSENPSQQLEKKTLSTKIFIIIDIFILAIIYIYLIGSLVFITECKTKSLCNLEIVSPYVSDMEYKQLKSTFYSIQTKDDYVNFTETINEIGEKYSLNLKK